MYVTVVTIYAYHASCQGYNCLIAKWPGLTFQYYHQKSNQASLLGSSDTFSYRAYGTVIYIYIGAIFSKCSRPSFPQLQDRPSVWKPHNYVDCCGLSMIINLYICISIPFLSALSLRNISTNQSEDVQPRHFPWNKMAGMDRDDFLKTANFVSYARMCLPCSWISAQNWRLSVKNLMQRFIQTIHHVWYVQRCARIDRCS